MPLFRYEAEDRTGKKVIGTMQVTDESTLSRRLQTMGYVPVMVQQAGHARPAVTAPAPGIASSSGAGVAPRVLSQFYYELYMSLQAGLPAFQALYDVAGHTAHPRMREIAGAMAERARGGGRLADEMARFPGVFNAAHVGLVRAGELGGFVVDALKELVAQIEADLEARRRCTVWILHFWLVAAFAVWLAIPMASIVRPAAEAMDARAGIPAVLRAFLFFSLPITLACLGAIFGFRRLIMRPASRARWHRILLRLPALGAVAVSRSRAVFAASLRLLYHGGVNPLDAWSAASEAVPNTVLSAQLAAQTATLHAGGRFSDAMRGSGLFPASDVGLLSTGERTGNIEEVLGRIADFYHQDAGSALARLPTIARTLLLLLAAAIAVPAIGYGFASYFNGIFEGIPRAFGVE